MLGTRTDTPGGTWLTSSPQPGKQDEAVFEEIPLRTSYNFTKENNMRTKLTLLAVLASASLLANAQSTAPAMSSTASGSNVQSIPSGNEPLNKAPAMKTPSDTTRSAVSAQAADAAKTGTISSGNEPLAPMTSPHSTTTRATKSSQGAAALAAGNIATGNEPIAGQMKSDKTMKKMGDKKMAKKGSDHAKGTSADADSVKSGNEPYNMKTPSTMSNKSRSDVNAETAMSGGAEGVKSGNQPLAPSTSTTSTKSRAEVKAGAAAAVKNDTIKTGDGAATAPTK